MLIISDACITPIKLNQCRIPQCRKKAIFQDLTFLRDDARSLRHKYNLSLFHLIGYPKNVVCPLLSSGMMMRGRRGINIIYHSFT